MAEIEDKIILVQTFTGCCTMPPVHLKGYNGKKIKNKSEVQNEKRYR